MTWLRNGVVYILSFLMIMPPQWTMAADAIVVESGASVTTTPSGKPMLNIKAPNGAGVSHNTFTNFNVTSQGLVINNATAITNTSIGGVIEANPNFAGRAASLIINEVTSSNRSELKGATEIGGQAADYILANPNGITCNGCGFINTPRATLTTGTPTFSGQALSRLSVNAGDVVIEGLGLDATKATKFDIVTRAATINAQVNAQDLGVFTGRQDFDYENRTGTAKADDSSPKPSFAIDSTALGGMYAGRITLVGTEAGLGVRIAGNMAASTGDMVLTADGKLELKSDLSAATDIVLASTSNSVVAEQDVYAGGTATATANSGAVSTSANASIGAAGDVTVKAANVTASSGSKIVAGMDSVGALTTSGTLDIQATTQIATGDGFLGGGAAVKLKTPTVDLSRATDDGTETVRARGTLSIESGNLVATNGRIAADGAMELKGNSPIVLGAGTYASPNTITLTGDSVTSAATITSDQAVNITSTVGDITNTGTITAGTTATLTSAANITNAGTIESQTGTTVTATGTLDNQSDAKIKSAQNTSITTGGTFTNVGAVYAVNAATLIAPSATNSGSLAAGTDLDINVASFTNYAGVLHAEDNITIAGYDGAARAVLFDNASGFVETMTGDITIDADTIKNRKAAFRYGTSSTKNVSRTLLASYTDSGDLGVGQQYWYWKYEIRTPIYTGVQFFMESPVFEYASATVFENSASSAITSGQNITLNGTTIANDYSTISAIGDINITAGTVNNEALSLSSTLYWNKRRSCSYSPFHGGYVCSGSSPRQVGATQVTLQEDSLIQAGGSLTITASGGTRNGTEKNTSTPSPWMEKVDSLDLIAEPTSSGLKDTSHYADLIPGRDVLFNASKDPQPEFVYETRVDFIDVNNFYGSDYFISKLPELPEDISSRLGDAYFDTTLVKQAILRETGKRWLDTAVKDDIQQMKNLLDNGLAAQGSLNLAFGIELTQAQIDALTTDIVWYVEEEYDGRTVLVPQVYLASATRATLTDRGAIMAAGGNLSITADTIDNDQSVIKAAGDVTLAATNDITSNSAKIKGGGNVEIASTTGDVNITTQVDKYSFGTGHQTVIRDRSSVEAGGKLSIDAGGDVMVLAADLKSGGDTAITAIGDATVGTRELRFHNGGDGDNSTDTVASNIASGGDLTLTSGGDARIKAAKLKATGDLTVQATGNVVVESGQDSSFDIGDWGSLTTVTQKRAELEAGGNVTLASLAGNASVISSTLDSGGSIQINTPNGALYLGARKDLFELREQSSSDGLFTTTYTNKGEIHETVVPTLMTAAGNIAIVTKNGTIVDYKDTGNLNESINQLSQAPGLAWMKDLQGRSDVQWNAVQEAHQSWDYSSQGISPMGAIIISAAVAIATSGVGAELAGIVAEGSQAAAGAGVAAGGLQAGSTVALAGGGSATVASASTVAMTNAGFTALVSQAATAFVGNNGDLGATLKQLGSMDTLKSLATSVVTAGLMAEIPFDKLMTSTDGLTGDALKMTEFGNVLKTRLAQATVKATVDSVINGAPLTDSMKSNLVTAAADSVSQFGSQLLGEAGLSEGDLRKVLGHAFVGGMSNAITGDDFVMGAAAGAVTELASPLIGQTFTDGATAEELAQGREARIQLAGVVAASTVALAGGDEGDIYRAASIAQIAQQYNHELHPSIGSVIDKLKTRRDQMDEVLAKTNPEAVKVVLQRMADAHTNTLDDIDINGLDENAIAVVQKYPRLINHIQLTDSETAGAAAGIAQSVGETVEDTLLLVTDQIYAAAWLLTGGASTGEGWVGEDAVARNAARVDAAVQVVSNYQQIPDNLKAYYQSQQDLIAQYRALGTDEGDFKAQQITAKLSTDITLTVAGVLVGGEGLVARTGEIITALKVEKTIAKAAGKTESNLADTITWIDEDASMSAQAKAYDQAAMGSRSNIETGKSQAPSLTRTTVDGQITAVRFDGVDGDVLIDRKLSVVTTQKAKNQLFRQSEALQQNGFLGRWEVPTQVQANRATKLFNELGVTNITVKVVPE